MLHPPLYEGLLANFMPIQITPTGCIRLLQYVEKKRRTEAKAVITGMEKTRRRELGVEKSAEGAEVSNGVY